MAMLGAREEKYSFLEHGDARGGICTFLLAHESLHPDVVAEEIPHGWKVAFVKTRVFGNL